jgi:hypothetical protein
MEKDDSTAKLPDVLAACIAVEAAFGKGMADRHADVVAAYLLAQANLRAAALTSTALRAVADAIYAGLNRP